MKKLFAGALFLAIMAVFCRELPAQPRELYSPNPAQRRQALISMARRGQRSLPYIGAALYDENSIVKRTAARILVDIGKPAAETLRLALVNSDSDVRRIALIGLESIGVLTPEDIVVALNDKSEVLRLEAVRAVSGFPERTPEIDELIRKATVDESHIVRAAAFKAMWESVSADGKTFDGASLTASRKSLREEHMDRFIETVHSYRLPAEDWNFRLDPGWIGHTNDWYAVDHDDSGWDTIGIELAWQRFGYEYIGVAWYRSRFDMPEKVDSDGVEIHFGGVDECGWVWINGVYAGEHDIGPSGWNVPFALDISELVNWGEKNQITVRVMNTAAAGGIWRPVTINFLKVR